jgi:putative tricarboxylic transport membrane protein
MGRDNRENTSGGARVQKLLQKKDFYAGLAMILLGSGVTLNATTYNLGNLMHMGPGMFPFMLGILLTFVGILIFVSGVLTPLADGERILPESMEWRGWGCILAGPVMFIIFGEFFGMVAATFSCVFVSALGDRQATLKSSAILAAGITVLGAVLFSYVLKVPFPLFRWGH